MDPSCASFDTSVSRPQFAAGLVDDLPAAGAEKKLKLEQKREHLNLLFDGALNTYFNKYATAPPPGVRSTFM